MITSLELPGIDGGSVGWRRRLSGTRRGHVLSLSDALLQLPLIEHYNSLGLVVFGESVYCVSLLEMQHRC